MKKLTDIEGIGLSYSKKLAQAGIGNQSQLLRNCSKRSQREQLARETGISAKLILKWTNQADLARIKGIGEEYGELLERSGVDSVPELAQRNAESLCQMISNTNHRLHLVRHKPGLQMISDWIDQAKHLPKAVFH